MNLETRYPTAAAAGDIRPLVGIAALFTVLAGLAWLKWPSALATVHTIWDTRTWTSVAGVFPLDGLNAWMRPLAGTANYLVTVWKALFFGLCISAVVRAYLNPWSVARLFGTGRARDHLVAGAAGVPLMLCSCCVAPVAATICRAGGRIGPSLGLLLASPSLNPAAIALTFLLFPRSVALARLAMAAAAVFLIMPLVGRGIPPNESVRVADRIAPPVVPAAGAVDRLMLAFAATAVRTLPILVAGVFLSVVLLEAFPLTEIVTTRGHLTALVLAALIATAIALPTFFELPLGLMLMSVGAPEGLVAAVLFAGPAVNLPSLLTIGRATSWPVPARLALAVVAVSVAGGWLLDLGV